jgi:hypothetical protein
MRFKSIEKHDADSSATLWIAAGTVLGVISGIVIAERLSGRPISARGLWLRSRGVAERALDKWEPLLDAAMAMREAWMSDDDEVELVDEELEDEESEEDLDDEELDDEELDDEELDDEDEDDDEDDDEDLDEDDDLDDEDDDTDDEDDDTDDDESADEPDYPPPVDERVLEAFSNDPVLADREIEIEETEPGAILLHGGVHSAREVAHAVTIARGVPGVTGVRQRLRVRDRR